MAMGDIVEIEGAAVEPVLAVRAAAPGNATGLSALPVRLGARPALMRWAGPVLRAGMTLGLLGLVLRGVDTSGLREPLLRVGAVQLLGIAALLCLSSGLGGLRWAYVLHGMGGAWLPGRLTAVFWAGAAVGQFVPSPLSDVARIWIACRRGLAAGDSVLSAVLERATMVLTLLLLVFAVLPLQGADVPGWQVLGVGVGLFTAGGLALASLAKMETWRHLLPRRLRAMLGPASHAFRSLLRSGSMVPVLATAMLSHLNVVIAATLLGFAMHLPLATADYLVIMPLVILGTVLPISISGWGVREGVAVALLVPLGVPAATALAFSVLLGLCLMAASLPGLLLFALGSLGSRKPATVAAVQGGAPT